MKKEAIGIAVNRAVNELKYVDEDIEFMTIILDFDGTVVEHAYPETGKDLPYCVETLKGWQEKYGAVYILSTMRSKEMLDNAVEWFKSHDIKLFGIQKHPTQETWTESPKCHGRFCIDDRNVGQPLMLDSRGIPCVDWKKTCEIFEPVLAEVHGNMKEYLQKSDKDGNS